MHIERLYDFYKKSTGVAIDSRKIKKGNLFFVLKGAEPFIDDALRISEGYAFTNSKKEAKKNNVFYVEDPLESLQALAAFHRKQFSSTTSFIAITGSNGKTTTKELLSRVLSKKYKVNATSGNLNNHIGLPLTLLSSNLDNEIIILELGASKKGDIEFLMQIAQPDYGYITNFGKAHLEGFGSIQGVIEGKSELYTYLIEKSNVIFVNREDPTQMQRTTLAKDRYIFSKEKTDEFLWIERLESEPPKLKLRFKEVDIYPKLIGNHNLTNLSAAIAIGNYFKVPALDIKEAIEEYIPKNNRLEEVFLEKERIHILLDAYNASPDSMREALMILSNLKGKKGAILGDMLELGTYSKKEHQSIIDLTISLNLDFVYVIGEHFNQVYLGNGTSFIIKFSNMKDLIDELKGKIKNDSMWHILIKGSRKMALENILEGL